MKHGKQLRVAAMTLLLVASVVTGAFAPVDSSPVQDAQAQELNTGNVACSSVGVWALLLSECTVKYGDIDTTGQTANNSHSDILGAAQVTDGSRERLTTEVSSRANASLGTAAAEGKYAAIEALNNGSSLTTAKSDATQAVNDYYAEQQKSLLIKENEDAQSMQNALDEINTTSGLDESDVFEYNQGFETAYINVTTYNNEKVEVLAVSDGNDVSSRYGLGFNEMEQRAGFDYGRFADTEPVFVKDPYSSNSVAMMQANEYKAAHNTLDENRKTAINNTRVVAEDIYANYSPGDITVEGQKSPIEQVRTSATEYNSTGSYAFAVATAAEMGYATNAKSAFVIDYTPNNTSDTRTLSGTMYSQPGAFENNSMKTNTTYDTANLSGGVTFVNQGESNAEQVQLNGTFTINEITDVTTGESLNSTQLQSSEFATTDTSSMNAQLEEWRTIRDDNQQATGATSGGSIVPDGRVIGNDVLALFGLVGVILVLVSRIQD